MDSRKAPCQPRHSGEGAVLSGLSSEHVPVLTAVDCGGGRVEGVLSGRSEAEIARVLDGRIAKGAVFCTDGLKQYRSVARRAGAEHHRFKPHKPNWLAKVSRPRPARKGALGLGRVNAHHAKLKEFINGKLHGVSTKYLGAYVGWLRFIGSFDASSEDFVDAAISGPKIWPHRTSGKSTQ